MKRKSTNDRNNQRVKDRKNVMETHTERNELLWPQNGVVLKRFPSGKKKSFYAFWIEVSWCVLTLRCRQRREKKSFCISWVYTIWKKFHWIGFVVTHIFPHFFHVFNWRKKKAHTTPIPFFPTGYAFDFFHSFFLLFLLCRFFFYYCFFFSSWMWILFLYYFYVRLGNT